MISEPEALCPDCEQPIENSEIKGHIKKCSKYVGLFLKPVQQLKVHPPTVDTLKVCHWRPSLY